MPPALFPLSGGVWRPQGALSAELDRGQKVEVVVLKESCALNKRRIFKGFIFLFILFICVHFYMIKSDFDFLSMKQMFDFMV